MKRRLISSSRFILSLVYLGVLVPGALHAQRGKNFAPVNYTYPAPNSTQVSEKTAIGIRFDEPVMKSTLQNCAIIVIGSLSGIHECKSTVALDGRTLIFTPEKIFFSGEKVRVSISPLECISGKNTAAYSFTFQISKSKILPHPLLIKPPESLHASSNTSTTRPWMQSIFSNNDTLPYDFPAIHITKSNNPAPGNIYLADFRSNNNDSGTYLIMLDNQGNVLFERSTWPSYATDFKPQPNGFLTYFDKDLGIKGTDFRYKYYSLDSNYVVRDSFAAANGYLTDDHELIFLPGGGYALIAEIDEQIDMRKFISNGDSNTTIVAGIIQEFDSAKNLIFEWRTTDHFAFSDMTHTDFSFPYLDFTHCNSLTNDGDTAFILSSRNLDEVTKISREDGHIIWRWGGNNNQFRFVNDSLIFSRQHAVRRLKNGNIIMFDNGVFRSTLQHNLPSLSRAVEYQVDEKAKIATKVWEYHHDPEIYSSIMGYVQELDNGSRLIGWGGCDSGYAVTEVKPDGSTALEIGFDPGVYSYRAFKYTKDQLKTSVSSPIPDPTLTLSQNYPNPFTASSTINFHIGARTSVAVIIYDAVGREIRTLFNGTVDAGNYTSKFDGNNLPSGAYFCKLITPSASLTRIMLLSK